MELWIEENHDAMGLSVYPEKYTSLYNETLRGCFTVGEKKKYQKIDN